MRRRVLVARRGLVGAGQWRADAWSCGGSDRWRGDEQPIASKPQATRWGRPVCRTRVGLFRHGRAEPVASGTCPARTANRDQQGRV